MRLAKRWYAIGDPLWIQVFAQATHTMVDSTSAAHMQNGVPLAWPSNFREHGDLPGTIESEANTTRDIRMQNIKIIRQMWESMTGKKLNCGCDK